MKFLIFIAPNNFRDESVAMIKMLFDRWNIGYDLTSYSNKECIGSHGASYRVAINTGKVSISDYDGILLVDGRGVEDYKLYDYRPLLDTLTQFNNREKMVGAIDNAIKILARANIIKDRKISAPNDEETKRLVLLFHGTPTENKLEISKNIVTIGDSGQLDQPLVEFLQNLGAI